MTLLRATTENIDTLFEGILIYLSDIGCESYTVPGWECKKCGWRIGSAELPPDHNCEEP